MNKYLQYLIISIIFIFIIIGLFIWMRRKINKIYVDANNLVLNVKQSIPTLNSLDRLNYTKDFCAFIDEMINQEIINIRRFEILLNQPNKNLDVDNVIKEVSSKVFNSIKKELFDDPNNIVTREYLMSYIQKRTVVFYINYINNNVASQL